MTKMHFAPGFQIHSKFVAKFQKTIGPQFFVQLHNSLLTTKAYLCKNRSIFVQKQKHICAKAKANLCKKVFFLAQQRQ